MDNDLIKSAVLGRLYRASRRRAKRIGESLKRRYAGGEEVLTPMPFIGGEDQLKRELKRAGKADYRLVPYEIEGVPQKTLFGRQKYKAEKAGKRLRRKGPHEVIRDIKEFNPIKSFKQTFDPGEGPLLERAIRVSRPLALPVALGIPAMVYAKSPKDKQDTASFMAAFPAGSALTRSALPGGAAALPTTVGMAGLYYLLNKLSDPAVEPAHRRFIQGQVEQILEANPELTERLVGPFNPDQQIKQ